jgi:hypothetical protein
MADSPALRQRRVRRHKAGDHSICRPGCGDRDRHSPPRLAQVRPLDAPDADLNPRESLIALARRLEEAHLAYPANAFIARELRATLLAIEAAEPAAADPMDERHAMATRVS